MSFTNVIEVATQQYPDQKPGTSGLRKRVTVFRQPCYTENFIQAILEATNKPKHLVVGGDGRYYSEEVIKIIFNICAANGVEKITITKGGILSTPAASALIRKLGADGGIILTASHNPGGENGDFGIKYNTSNGGPAPEVVTDKIYEATKIITSYKSQFKRYPLDFTQIHSFTNGPNMKVDVVDPVDNYLQLLKEVFDFDLLKTLFKPQDEKKNFKMIVDCMNGVVGPYAERIFVKELGAPESFLINSKPLPDFGGKHPDPNLTYASDLVNSLKADSDIDFGVAFDGDGDRNMVLGQNAFFVTPGDSLAIIGAHINKIEYFSTIAGFARSFPTAPAIDRVAESLGVKCYETPTGWKYFCNLLDEGLISLCGEESFGLGSKHIREKDGLFACLAWLSIIAKTGKTVKELVEDHWKQFGRDYFCRYDYEECDGARCLTMIKELERLFAGVTLNGKKYGSSGRYVVKEVGNFKYCDCVEQRVSENQGLFVKFVNGARIVIRLSGTGSCGATVRLYVSDYSKENIMEDSQSYLQELLDISHEITKIKTYTGMDKPTVIT